MLPGGNYQISNGNTSRILGHLLSSNKQLLKKTLEENQKVILQKNDRGDFEFREKSVQFAFLIQLRTNARSNNGHTLLSAENLDKQNSVVRECN